ncbi:MAG TPA: hypothetical protein VGA36_10675 [Nitriliruptorales bacterium]
MRRIRKRARVADGLEGQPVRWCDPGGGRPVASLENLPKPVHGTTSLPDLDEAADDRADLLVAERRAAKLHVDLVIPSSDRELVDAPEGGAAVRTSTEAGEVVLADQGLGRLLHRPQPQRPGEMPYPVAVTRVDRGAIGDEVAVLAFGRAEPGVEVWRDVARGPDRDLVADQPVEP